MKKEVLCIILSGIRIGEKWNMEYSLVNQWNDGMNFNIPYHRPQKILTPLVT